MAKQKKPSKPAEKQKKQKARSARQTAPPVIPDPTAAVVREVLEARPRARQNVVLELGFFVAKLGRKNVAALYRNADNFEFPSDTQGVLYTSYDGADGAWRFSLADELKAAGYSVSKESL